MWGSSARKLIEKRYFAHNGGQNNVVLCGGFPRQDGWWYDYSPYRNKGTITEAVWTKATSGMPVLSFDGTNDKVTVANAASLNITAALTVEAWVKKDATVAVPNYRHIVVKGDGYTLLPYFLCYYVLADEWYFQTSDGISDFVANFAGAATWTHLVGTFDSANTKLYVNGALKTTTASAVTLTTNTTTLGVGGAGTRFFDGLIGKVQIHNRAMGVAEILGRYNTEKHLYGL